MRLLFMLAIAAMMSFILSATELAGTWEIGEKKRGTPAQVALAWLLAQKPWIVAIPGTTKLHRLEENLGAVNVELSAEDLRDVDTAVSKIEIQGLRLPEFVLRMSEG